MTNNRLRKFSFIVVLMLIFLFCNINFLNIYASDIKEPSISASAAILIDK